MTNSKIKITDAVTRVPVKTLKRNPWNPNRMTVLEMQSLLHGIQTEGFIDPLHVQKGTNVIIDGEHRWKCARKLGMTEVPVIYLDVDDTQARKLTLAFIHRRGRAKDNDVALLVQEIQGIEKHSLKRLELDTAIAKASLEEMLAKVDTAEQELAQEMNKKKAKKAASAKAKAGKLDVQPDEPDGGFKESDVENDEAEETHRYPVTFFAPTIEERALFKALCWDSTAAEFSFNSLKVIVDFYLAKHPKKASKVAAQVAAGE
jgi:hypothetical protein